MASMASCTVENPIRPPPPRADPLRACSTDTNLPLHTSPIVPAPGPAKSGRPSSPPKNDRRQVQDVAVDQAGGVEVVGHGRPALDQQLEHAAPSELGQDVVAGRPTARVPGAPGRPRAPGPARPAGLGVVDARRPSRTVSSGSSARTVPAPTRTASERARRQVHVLAGGLTGDPAAGAVGGGGAGVEAGRHLEDHPGLPGRAVLEIGGELLGHLFGRHPDRDLDPRLAERGDAPPGHQGIGVLDADYDPRHSGRDRWRRCRAASGRGARRLERHVERGAPAPPPRRPRARRPRRGGPRVAPWRPRRSGRWRARSTAGSRSHSPPRDSARCPSGPPPPTPLPGACAPHRPWVTSSSGVDSPPCGTKL